MNKGLILEQLTIMGFEPVCIDDGKYMFEHKEVKFLLALEDDNEEFLSISIPIFDEFTEENKMTVYESVNMINTLVRYVKLTIRDNYVSSVYEHRLSADSDLEELLENIIQALSTSVILYTKK